MVIKFRTYINSVDTNNWDFLYCYYNNCTDRIDYERVYAPMVKGKGESKVFSALTIEPKLTPKDCELCVEFFELSDSSYRDTLYYRFGNRMEAAVGINTIEANEPSVEVYPNPTTEQVTIKSKAGISSFQMMGLSGKVVLSENHVQSTNHHVINLSELKPGPYFIRIEEINGKVVTRRLMVQ